MIARLRRLLAPHAGPVLVALALSSLYFILDLRGGDLAAHLYRAELFKHDGFFVWNYNWYGGHYVVSYGVIFPTLSATIGVRLAGALSYLLGVLLFSILARTVFPRRGASAAAYVFAVVFSATLVIGQLPYALAISLGLGALAAAATGRAWIAAFLAVNCALTSPLAALFISFVAFTVWLGGHPWETLRTARHAFRTVWESDSHSYLVVALCTLLPATAASLLFPEGGAQPFVVASYLSAVALTSFFWLMVRDELAGDARRMVATGVVLYLSFLTFNELVPSPVGGNAVRLGMVLLPPVAAAILWPRSGRYALAVIVPLLCWQGATAFWAIATADETGDPHYFAPVNRFLDAKNPKRDQKAEIVFTRNHFEAAYVANQRPIARGWERQLDTKYNALFYDGSLDPRTYARWLIDNDVRWVILPKRATLDYSGRDEAELIRGGLPYLEPAADFRDWQIFRVTLPERSQLEPEFRGENPTGGFTIRPPRWGVTRTEVRWQRFLRPSFGCLRGDDEGFVEIVLPKGGVGTGRVSSRPPVITITSDFSLARLMGRGYTCAEGWTTDEDGQPVRIPPEDGENPIL